MRVELGKDCLIITPETEFEADFLQEFKIGNVFHKTGISPSDYIGIKINRAVKSDKQNDK